ncbi:hypothetical protein DL93DRAFT_2212490 [Clavulina sp. PMI_390]|nr:hypothetical protein DL93DRAFT_2212490 [Clavulina sp. PMI_390]
MVQLGRVTWHDFQIHIRQAGSTALTDEFQYNWRQFLAGSFPQPWISKGRFSPVAAVWRANLWPLGPMNGVNLIETESISKARSEGLISFPSCLEITLSKHDMTQRISFWKGKIEAYPFWCIQGDSGAETFGLECLLACQDWLIVRFMAAKSVRGAGRRGWNIPSVEPTFG